MSHIPNSIGSTNFIQMIMKLGSENLRKHAKNMNMLTQSLSHYMIIHKNINSILCYANKHDDIAIIGTSSHELCQIQWTQ